MMLYPVNDTLHTGGALLMCDSDFKPSFEPDGNRSGCTWESGNLDAPMTMPAGSVAGRYSEFGDEPFLIYTTFWRD